MKIPARNVASRKDFGIHPRGLEFPIKRRNGVRVRDARLYSVFALLVALPFVSPLRAVAQEGGRLQVGADYNFVHANAPPSECGCFSMNGGDAWAGWNLTQHFAVVGQVAVLWSLVTDAVSRCNRLRRHYP